MGDVTYKREGNVAVFTISAPEVRNALTPEMSDKLLDYCEMIDADISIGAAVIQGAGGTFCSGADTREWGGMRSPASEENYILASKIYKAFTRVGELKVPTVAAVRGVAVGAGINLYLATDLRIVASNARLLSGFLKIGIHPGGGFFTLANRLAGRETAAALGLFGQEISGSEAVQRGLAWEAIDDAQVEGRALEMAAIAAQDPELVRHAVGIFRGEIGPPSVSWSVAVEMERGIQMWSQQRRSSRMDEG
jgi:enoyl-CoA hydratase